MIKTVAKHSYIKGRRGKDRGRAHINYIAYRGGSDREQGGRKFFDKTRDDISADEVKKLMYEHAHDRGVTMHKFILSPGVDADVREYTRELLEQLEREKGLQFQWSAVVHDNTDHIHAHVVIMGKDKNGHLVRFNKEDHKRLRQLGDEYLDREHKLDRYLDREMHDLLKSKDFDRGGDDKFKSLLFGDKHKERDKDRDRDRREFEKFDKDMKRSLQERSSGDLYRVKGQQRIREQAGKFAEHHGEYTSNVTKQRLEKMAQDNPELAESINKELQYMKEVSSDNRLNQSPDKELERLLGFDKSQERKRVDKTQTQSSYQSFESDRLTRSQEQSQDRDSEREKNKDDGSS